MTRSLPVLSIFFSAAMAADLPVREVVLYKSGVGYFERSGEVAAGEAAHLDFTPEEMNDVLKSLSVAQKGGARITALRYDASDVMEHRLADFPFGIDDGEPLSTFLDHLRGARIELKVGNETVTGQILSARSIASNDKQPQREQIALLADSGEIRNYDLAAVSSIRFSDGRLQEQLKGYLRTVEQARSKDKRTVYVDGPEGGRREVVATYTVAMPVWKSSYRLVFADSKQPELQGWAIVDNTTTEDWKDVKLSVVSGRPVSFISSLYEPKYLQRPTVDLPEDRAVSPVLYEGAMMKAAAPPPPPPPAAARKAISMGRNTNSEANGAVFSRVEEFGRLQTATPNLATADLGELFEYRFNNPVTIHKGESTMLPFVGQPVDARKLLIYSESYGQNPMSAAEVTNNTGKTLDGGPITIFENDGYAGEALIGTVKSGDKRLISYALDLGTRVSTNIDSGRELVREIHIQHGMLTARTAVEETKTYTIHNVDSRAKTLWIEHPQRPQYKLVGQTPVETTNNSYRFEVKLAAATTQKFPVAEEHVYDTTNAVTNVTPDTLLVYTQNKALPEVARRQLQQILEAKQRISELDAQIHSSETELNELTRDQDRVRQNIISLNNVSSQQDQVQKYSRQLGDQETRLTALHDSLSNLRKQRAATQTSLNVLIEHLSF